MCILPCHASLNRTCIILVCASFLVYVLVVYYVVCFFSGVCFFGLVGSDNVEVVRIHSSTSVCLLHGLVLLPCGISGKMTVTLDTTTIFALVVVSMLSLCRATYHLLSRLPNCHEAASNLFHHPSKPLFGYVTALLSPSYSVASCRLFHVGTWISRISWDIIISLI